MSGMSKVNPPTASESWLCWLLEEIHTRTHHPRGVSQQPSKWEFTKVSCIQVTFDLLIYIEYFCDPSRWQGHNTVSQAQFENPCTLMMRLGHFFFLRSWPWMLPALIQLQREGKRGLGPVTSMTFFPPIPATATAIIARALVLPLTHL